MRKHEHWDKVLAMEAGVPEEMQTQAEFERLVKLARAGDQDALLDIYWRASPLVFNLAIKYGHGGGGPEGHTRYNHAQREEIRQEAWAGLQEAINLYDPAKRTKNGRALKFWTVVSYRITNSIKEWQAKNSGGLPMPKQAWEDAWRIQKALDNANLVEWESLSDEALKAATGKHSAGAILRARRSKAGHVEEDELAGASWSTVDNTSMGAEDAHFYVERFNQWQELSGWLQGLDAIPRERWEDAVYWKLEQLELAGDIEAAKLIEYRDVILAAEKEEL